MAWVETTLASDELADVRAKLAATGCNERHVFVGLTYGSPGEVFFALDQAELSLPTEIPLLPKEVTHVWMMRSPPTGRCIALFPGEEWIDVMEHWRISRERVARLLTEPSGPQTSIQSFAHHWDGRGLTEPLPFDPLPQRL
jgi:hypothetical protein